MFILIEFTSSSSLSNLEVAEADKIAYILKIDIYRSIGYIECPEIYGNYKI